MILSLVKNFGVMQMKIRLTQQQIDSFSEQVGKNKDDLIAKRIVPTSDDDLEIADMMIGWDDLTDLDGLTGNELKLAYKNNRLYAADKKKLNQAIVYNLLRYRMEYLTAFGRLSMATLFTDVPASQLSKSH